MKKVLIITYYWPPAGGGGVQRWVKFAKYLREFGWEPIIYTAKDAAYPILDASLLDEVDKDMTVLKQSINEPYDIYKKWIGKPSAAPIDANFLSQGKKLNWKDRFAVWVRGNFFIPDARCWWIKPSVRFLSEYLSVHTIDAIVSTGPPHSCHLIAFDLAQKYKLPWIVDYRDPWTQIDYFDDLRLTPWAKHRHLSLEKKVLKHCDVIITVGKTMAVDLKTLTDTRTEVITNGFDEADRPSNSAHQSTGFLITYIGTMNDARNPEVFWSALSKLKKTGHPIVKSLKVQMVGKPEEVVFKSVSAFGLEDVVEFIGYVNHKEAIDFQNKASALLLVINKTHNNKSILTGKIFEYIASGKPIICIGPKDGDAAEILQEAKTGVIIDYDDVEAMENALIKTYESNGLSRTLPQEIEKFSRLSLTKKLATVLDRISSK